MALKSPLQAVATRLRILVPLAIVLGLGASRGAPAEIAPQCQPAWRLRLSAEPPPPGADATPRGIQSELRVAAVAGTYLRFLITPGYDLLVVRQLRLDGTLVERLELQANADEQSHLSWIVTTPGVYLFVVAPAAPASPTAGAYAIALEEERPVGACDETRLRVERAVAAVFVRLVQHHDEPAAAVAASEEIARTAADADAVGELETIVAAQIDASRAAKRLKKPDAADRFKKTLALAIEIGDSHSQAFALEALAELGSGPDADAERTLEMTRGLGLEGVQASLHTWIGLRRESNGDLAGAAEEFRQALASQWRTGNVKGQVWTLIELGDLQHQLGDTERSRGYLEVALERAEAAADRADQVLVLRDSALLAIDRGELQTASDELKSAHCLLVSAATPEEAKQAAWLLDHQGLLDLYLGETDKARSEFTDALAAFERLRLPGGLAHAHLGLGAAWQAANQRGPALANFQQALDLIKANSIPGDARAQALYLLGKANLEEQPAKALAELQEALSLPAASVRHAQIGLELARAYSGAGRAEAAETAFRGAIDLAAEAHAPVVEAAAQAGLARAELARGQLAVARTAIERAIQLTEELRSTVIDADQRMSFLASRREYFEIDVDVLMGLDQLEPGAGHDREAFAASERARARGLLDLLAVQEVKVGEIVPADLKLRQQEIDDRIATLQSRLLSSASRLDASGQEPGALADLERALASAEEDEENLAVEANRRRPGYFEVRAPHPQALFEVQRLLDAKTAFLEYFVGKKASYLFVVTQHGLYAHELPAPKERLARLAGDLAAAVRQESRLHARDFAGAAYYLYSLAVLPAAAELTGIPRWIVAPDGPLYTVSFDALLTEPVRDTTAPRPYLIRRHTVSYAPSASVLAQLLGGRRRPASAPSEAKLFVGFGDPTSPLAGEGAARGGDGCPGLAQDLSGAPGAGGDLRGAPASAASGGDPAGSAVPAPARLAALPAARQEVCGISRLFPAGTTAVFLGASASEENVKRSALVASARDLHFATHGLLDEVNPNRSGLQLAHGAGSREDGLLQVREVFNLELQADLVVLSACSTGQGKEVSGEGLIGMTRAFLYAGAASVVVTLWAVDDSSTSDLMVEFYRQLLATGDKADALRHAKLAMLDSARYSHPHYWAPFILIGRQL